MFNDSLLLHLFTSTTFLVTVCCGLFIYIAWKCWNDPLRHIPKPNHSFLFGHLKELKNSPDLYVLLEKWYNQYKDVGLYRMDAKLGPERVVIINPEFARQIFVTNASKYYRAGIIKEFFPNSDDGLFISNGAAHTFQRKLLNPMFSYGTVLGFLPIFQKHTVELVDVWQKKIEQSPDGFIDAVVFDNLNYVALDIIGHSAFGHEFNSVSGNRSEMHEALNIIYSQRVDLKARIYNKILPFMKYLPTPGKRQLAKATDYIQSLLKELVSTSKQSLEEDKQLLKENLDQNLERSDLQGKPNSLLKLLLLVQEQGNKAAMPTDSRVRDNVFSFLFAGHETTASTLMWTLYLLAQHTDIQEKGHQESFSILDEYDELTENNIDQLEYIDCIIKESMRLCPAAPIVMRRVNEEDTLGTYHLPKDTIVMMDLISMQRSEDLWEDAKSFKPERFYQNDSDEYKKSSAFRYFPFTAGPRSCIGRRFALMEMKVILSFLLKNFRFGIDADHPAIERRQLITMKSSPEITLRVSAR